jgi:GAF domain-containing protein
MRSFLVVPLLVKDEVFGTIAFHSVKEDNYSDREVRLAQGIATQISGAVSNAQLHRELKQTKEELQRLLAASPAMIFRATASGEYTTTFISDNVKAILGLESRDILAEPGLWSRHIHP